MSDEEIRRLVEGDYDEAQEDTLRSCLKEAFSKQMRTTAIICWANFLFFFGLAIACGALFLLSEQTKSQIMYAALFVCFAQWSTLIKVYGWQVLNKNRLVRQMKRLEMRLVEELSGTAPDG